MPGLLDGRGGFDDPLTMGLLGASQAFLTPVSQGGGLGAAFGAFPAAQQAAEANRYRQLLQSYQLRKMQQEDEDRQTARELDAQMRRAAQNAFVQPSAGSLGGGVTPGSQQGRMLLESMSGDPEFDAANLRAINSGLNAVGPKEAVSLPTAGGFDQNKFFNDFLQVAPLQALKMRKDLQPESPWAKINPKDFTPESVARFAATNDPSVLMPVPEPTNLQFHQGTTGNDYSPGMPPTVFDPRTGAWRQLGLPQLPGAAQPTPSNSAPTGGFTPQPPQAPTVSAEQPDPLAPWAGLPPRRADDVRVREGERIRKQLDEERQNLAQESATLGKMRQFGALNRRTATGDVLSKTLPSVSSFISDDAANMKALTASLAPRERVPGSGTTSDKDLALFVQAVPSIDKPGPVNKAIRDARQAQFARDTEYLNAKEAYFARRGHVSGFDAEWQKYANAVPLFAEDATPEDFKLNTNTVTFDQWQKGKLPPAAASRQSGIGTPSVSGQVLGPKPRATQADVEATFVSMKKTNPSITRQQVIDLLSAKYRIE